MGYKLHNICYSTEYDFLAAFAQECHRMNGTSLLSCIADPAGHVVIQAYSLADGLLGDAWNYYPQLVECTAPTIYTVSDTTELAWKVALVWAIAFGIKQVARVIYKTDN